MRHLMSPLDFSVEELDKLFTLPVTLNTIPLNMRMPAPAKSLLHAFMNQAHVPD